MAPSGDDDASWPERPAVLPGQQRARRGSYAVGTARRATIVDAAVEVFSSTGFHKGTLRDVADKVGLSQAGLLHHFPSKEHLLQAVLGWRDDDAAAQLGDPVPEGIDLLRALVELARRNQGTPELVRLHVVLSAEGTSVDHPLHTYFSTRSVAVLALVRGAFEHAEAHGGLKPDVDLGSATRGLLALWDGLQVQWLFHPDDVDVAADLQRYLQSLLTVEL
jgi:AcrR family transcriptional regulator